MSELMYLVLLTGGLASGKGYVRSFLEERGALTLDLDCVARELQNTPAVLQQLAEAFGAEVVDAAGQLDRRLLADRAFARPEDTARLNAICWPAVVAHVEGFLAKATRRVPDATPEAALRMQPAATQSSPEQNDLVVIEVPLLVESGALLDRADEVLVVVAPEHLRLERACARGMRAADATRRLERQATDAERVAISDTVFDNSGSREDLCVQVQAWYDQRKSEGRF